MCDCGDWWWWTLSLEMEIECWAQHWMVDQCPLNISPRFMIGKVHKTVLDGRAIVAKVAEKSDMQKVPPPLDSQSPFGGSQLDSPPFRISPLTYLCPYVRVCGSGWGENRFMAS